MKGSNYVTVLLSKFDKKGKEKAGQGDTSSELRTQNGTEEDRDTRTSASRVPAIRIAGHAVALKGSQYHFVRSIAPLAPACSVGRVALSVKRFRIWHPDTLVFCLLVI